MWRFPSGRSWREAALLVLGSQHSGNVALHLLAWPCDVFRSTRFLAVRLDAMQKNARPNESQQCLSKLAANPKTLCNWDTVNISKLPYNKLSVFIYFHIIFAFFLLLKQSAIKGAAPGCGSTFFKDRGRLAWNYFSTSFTNSHWRGAASAGTRTPPIAIRRSKYVDGDCGLWVSVVCFIWEV